MEDRILHKDLSYRIVGLSMQVHRELGPGFLEKVYENALMIMSVVKFAPYNSYGIQQLRSIEIKFVKFVKIRG